MTFEQAVDTYTGKGSTSAPATSTPSASQQNFSQSPYGLLSTVPTFNPKNSTDAAAFTYIQSYLSGNAPSVTGGMGGVAGSMYKNRIASRAQVLYKEATGKDLPDQDTLKTQLDNIDSNNQLLNNLNIQTGTIAQNAKLLQSNLASGNVNTSAPIINKMVNDLAAAAGNVPVAQYLSQQETLKNELASLLSVKNASGTTVADKLSSADVLPSGATPDQINQIVSTLMQEAQNQSSTILTTNAQLYLDTDPIAVNPQNPVNNTITMSDGQGNQAVSNPGQLTPQDLQSLLDEGATIISQQ